jgi:hypothetical protein
VLLVVGAERAEVEVGDGAVGGAAEVAVHVGGRGDADEDGLVVARRHAQADLAVPVAVEDPAGDVGVDLELVRGDRVGARGEAVGACGEVALLVLLGVAPEERAAGGEEAQ